ncbi:ThiF family adenylyltransferase, partial [Klebsiella pneumoniae]|nr:ThiF family adenylyltransferase [Klebsiella pneumoniae]
GLGSPAGLYLASAGVGRITIVDDDAVELSNLQRQIAHDTVSLGQGKAESAAERMRALNPSIEVRPLAERLSGDRLIEEVAAHD